ncbi:ComEC/Rec2 family competence protein [Pseudaestuariivita atlantica]|uniref:Competence protein n=1 Tax=Pseudaestuariivita atlantica TaxID=1317121 RepID=A0A0L1JMK3_9RHOB|nr:ComEC/Rec2 family competence protein [Pseudaestuariivita atlantica]KNG92981.1 hypothetical protein ATO11_13700 [Pseudaestuariivita atlantica]
MTLATRVSGWALSQQGHFFPWAPVCLGAGIGAYFSLDTEPTPWVLYILAALALFGALLALRAQTPLLVRVVIWAGVLAALGVVLAAARTHNVSGPVLAKPVYGAVAGRIVKIDRSASGLPRLTLDQVALSRVAPADTPRRVRVSVAKDGPHTHFLPGRRVGTTAYIAPPRGAAEPGGFDFRRHAWFQKLGGVGYSRVPVVAVEDPERTGFALWITQVRLALSARLQAALPGPEGGVLAAIVTGDRSALDPRIVEDLRATNLAHLLAISGLHMGLAAGVVFGMVRGALALAPSLALRWPIRRIAAVAGFLAAAAYLALSGGNVATERAFIMVSVALGAVLLDRRALSLRAVALAALIVLALRPEALLSPGFQMSFAATTALVAAFAGIRELRRDPAPGWLRPVIALVVSSGVAGIATAPVAAAHFNMFAHYGLIANLLSVPLMGAVIMPFAIAGLVLMPLGLAALPLWVSGQGIGWILGVADRVAGWDGSVSGIATPAGWVLPALALAGLWLALVQGRGRFAALPALALVLTQWSGDDRPDVLIDAEGQIVGVRVDDMRALSRAKGAGFVAGIWLENDGLRVEQAKAAQSWNAESAGWDIVHVAGKRAARTPPPCARGRLIVSNVPLTLDGPCLVLDLDKLRDSGSIALWRDGTGLRARIAHVDGGARPWSPRGTAPPGLVDWMKTVGDQ